VNQISGEFCSLCDQTVIILHDGYVIKNHEIREEVKHSNEQQQFNLKETSSIPNHIQEMAQWLYTRLDYFPTYLSLYLSVYPSTSKLTHIPQLTMQYQDISTISADQYKY
jgi:hypothetical protein